MTRVRVAAYSLALDGFGAGPSQDLNNPMGVGGVREGDARRFEEILGGSKMTQKTKPEWELKLERVIDAPLNKVWDAWAKPEQVAKWFAPQPLSLEVHKMELRSGGTFKMSMVWPDGKQRHDFGGDYVEVVPQKKIVWKGAFPGDPKDNIRTEVDFTDLGGKTKINVRQMFFVVTDVNRGPLQGANQGWNMTLDQLTAFVSGGKS